VLHILSRLTKWYKHWYPNPQYVRNTSCSRAIIIPHRSSTILKAYRTTFQTLLSSILSGTFRDAFVALLTESVTFSAEANADLFRQLDILGLLDRYESLLSNVVYQQIEHKVSESCPKEWSETRLTGLREWLKETLVPWLAVPYSRGSKTGITIARQLNHSYSHFHFSRRIPCDGIWNRVKVRFLLMSHSVRSQVGKGYLFNGFTHSIRISEIFDIIVDYPDSQEGLQDLKVFNCSSI
jgi:anaphase-promoting complex subunit 2